MIDGQAKASVNAAVSQQGAQSGRGEAQSLAALGNDLDAVGRTLIMTQELVPADLKAKVVVLYRCHVDH